MCATLVVDHPTMFKFASYLVTQTSEFLLSTPESYERRVYKLIKECPTQPATELWVLMELVPKFSIKRFGDFGSWECRISQEILPVWFKRAAIELRVREALEARASQIPFDIPGNLFLSPCTRLVELPNDLQVHGWVTLTGCPIRELPSRLHITRDLNLLGCPVDTLPPDLWVGGDLNICGCPIKTIPESAYIGGRIFRD